MQQENRCTKKTDRPDVMLRRLATPRTQMQQEKRYNKNTNATRK